jgi:hypothetical protein
MTLRFGFDIRTLESVSALGFNGSDNYGTFQYNTQASAGLFTGVDFADFLSGLPYQTFYDVVQARTTTARSNHYHFFAQDQWKPSNQPDPDLWSPLRATSRLLRHPRRHRQLRS